MNLKANLAIQLRCQSFMNCYVFGFFIFIFILNFFRLSFTPVWVGKTVCMLFFLKFLHLFIFGS